MKKKKYVIVSSLAIISIIIVMIFIYNRSREEYVKNSFSDNYYIFNDKILENGYKNQGIVTLVHFTKNETIQMIQLNNAYNYYTGKRNGESEDLKIIKEMETEKGKAIDAQFTTQFGEDDSYITYLNIRKFVEEKANFSRASSLFRNGIDSTTYHGHIYNIEDVEDDTVETNNSHNQLIFLGDEGNTPYSIYKINYRKNSEHFGRSLDISKDGSLVLNQQEKAKEISKDDYLSIKLSNDDYKIYDVSSPGSTFIYVKDLFNIAYNN